MNIYQSRLKLLRDSLDSQKTAGMVVSKRENIYYLTGLKQVHPVNREALLFITPNQTLLYHSPFLSPPNHPWIEAVSMSATNTLESALSALFSHQDQPSTIAIEAHNLTVAEHTRIQAALPQFSLTPTTDIIETIRLTKEKSEIASIQKACQITFQTMTEIIQKLTLSHLMLSEIDLSRLIEQKLYDLGADGVAFPTIVAFGPNSALPHHFPGSTKLMQPINVLLDFGCTYQGYAADMSRTLFLGETPSRFKAIESVVLSAYQAGLNLLRQHYTVTELTIKPEIVHKSLILNHKSSVISASQLDAAVRQTITNAGYGDRFIHTSGHGLGLEIHESPSLNVNNYMELKPGMVITLEPGVYLPGRFGYRHENTIQLS